MANPTTNYGWPMPTSTDLVTDLPADFALFGQPVDTSLKALNPETTLGDIAYRSSTSNTNTRLGIGSTSQVLTVVSGVPAWAAAATGGKLLQVVQGTTSTAASNSTTTFADTNLTANITPSLNTSKILIMVVQQNVAKDAGNASSQLLIRLMRDATSLGTFVNGQLYTGTTVNNYSVATINYLDSPATTSAITYKTQFANAIAAASVKVQGDSQGISTILLLEIGA